MKTRMITPVLFFFLFSACTIKSDSTISEDKNTMIEQSELIATGQHPVMFYNVENLFDTENDPHNSGDDKFTPEGENFWDKERYNLKLEHLAFAMLAGNNETPLICGFAELENRKVLEDLCHSKLLKGVNYKITHFDSDDRRGVDCGFIYDADRFSPTLETKISIRMSEDPNFRTRDILYIKGQVIDGKEIHVFVNHWSSRREGQEITEPRRVQAAKILRMKIDEILSQNASANIIVMGDFNDTPLDKSLCEVLRAKGQHELFSGDLVNLFIEEQKNNLGTSVFRGDWDVLDQLIISQGLLNGKSGVSVEKNNAFIVKNDKLLYTYRNGDQKPGSTYGGNKYYGGYSDHLPVYLILK